MSAIPPATTWSGSLNRNGSPIISLQIGGILPNSAQEFEVIIDTGFTGFIAMPMVKAFPLGLALTGTTTVMLADGKSAYKLTALGAATIGGKTEAGVILLDETSNDILLGMDFLRRFKRVLFVHPNLASVILFDEDYVNKMVLDAANKQAKTSAEQPTDEADVPPPEPSTEPKM